MIEDSAIELSPEWMNYRKLYKREYQEEGAIFRAPWFNDLKNAIIQGVDIDEFLASKDKKHYVAFLQTDEDLLKRQEILKEYRQKQQEALEKLNSSDFKSQREKEVAEETVDYYQRKIDNQTKKIEDRKNEFSLSSEENDCIRDFISKNKELLTNPPQISDTEAKESGLTQEYIEGKILHSKYPDAGLRSIRQFYEGLNAPAAPRMAYNGRASKSEKGKDINPEDMVAKLREKGLDAVLATDERASDPHVFVVNHDSIFSPFLEPKDALKANIAMIEATRDLGGFPSLSNPLLRESMVKAAEPEHNIDLSDAKIDTYSKNKKHNPEQLSSYLSAITSEWSETKTSYSNLSNIIDKLKNENSQLYNDIVRNISEGYTQLNAAGQWNIDNAEKLAQKTLKAYNEKLNPYVFDINQANMANEAFEKGETPYELDRRAKEFMARNGYPESVFHAGKQGANPYAVLCSEKEGNMCMLYGAATVTSHAENNERYNIHGDGCLGYAFGMSTHTKRDIRIGKYQFGFLYEYESRKEKQEMQFLDISANYSGGKFDINEVKGNHDETAILPHQNKLKKIYLALEDQGKSKIFPLEIDENGKIKDKKWRDFVEMYNPINDNMSGKMVERQNNMLAEYDAKGKDNMYRKIEQLNENNEQQNVDVNIEDKNLSASSLKAEKEAVSANDNLTHATQTNENSSVNNDIQKKEPEVQQPSQVKEPEIHQKADNIMPDGKYSEAAEALIEQRAKWAYEYANPYGMVSAEQKEMINLRKEHEIKMAKVITKVMEEKGSDLFASGDPKKVEAILKEQALKDGLLVEKNSELFGKSVSFNNGGTYMENEAGFYGLAVSIAQQKMDMEIAKLPPERQEEAKKGFYSCNDATQQAAYAMNTVAKLSENHKRAEDMVQTSAMPLVQGDLKNMAQKEQATIIISMRMGHNPLLEASSNMNQKTFEKEPLQQTQNNAMSAMMINQMVGAQR